VGSAVLIHAGADTTCAARGSGVQWIRTAASNEQGAIDRWCAGVGPPARIETARPPPAVLSGSFAVVSWNTHVGGGDLGRLVSDLREGRLTGAPVDQFVLLLQEVYRAGPEVPVGDPDRMNWAAAERIVPPSGAREDIVSLAHRLGLGGIYVPSMRNGSPGRLDEDRGNAILASLALSEPTAIELPLERQRRVAIEATAHTAAGLAIRIVDTHFTNMVMHHLWLFSESGRLRQARALAGVLPSDGALIVGGDFNAWFGFHDAAYRELAVLGHASPDEDRRPSFGPMRLDHVLFRLPETWKTRVRRADDRYGSDHYPLVASVDPG
jgi:endonuclease/exonuclease/phosphatase family metal-dependent hydrolase